MELFTKPDKIIISIAKYHLDNVHNFGNIFRISFYL